MFPPFKREDLTSAYQLVYVIQTNRCGWEVMYIVSYQNYFKCDLKLSVISCASAIS